MLAGNPGKWIKYVNDAQYKKLWQKDFQLSKISLQK